MKLTRLLLILLAPLVALSQTYVDRNDPPTFPAGRGTGPGNLYDIGTGGLLVWNLNAAGGGAAGQTGSGPVTGTTARITLATDGPANVNLEAIRYASEEAVAGITVPQTSFAMTAVNQSITVGVDAGVDLSFATAVPNFTAGGTFEVRFEQFDGTAWSDLSVTPKTLIAGSAPVVSATSVGLYRVRVPVGITQVRIRLSALSGLTEVRGWIERFTDGAKIQLPYVGFTGGTFGLATNNPVVPAIQWDRLGDVVVDIQTFAGTSQTLTWQATNDHSGTNWAGAVHRLDTTSSPLGGVTTTAAGVYKIVHSRQYFRVNLSYTTITSLVVNGITATVTSASTPSEFIVVGGPTAAGTTTGIGNPVPVAGQVATGPLTTAHANNRLTLPVFSPSAEQVVRTGQIRAGQSQNSITLSTTTETTLLPQVASLFQDITTLIIANPNAGAVNVTLRPATASGTTHTFTVAGNSTFVFSEVSGGLLQLAVNNNWTAQLSAAQTVHITAKANRFVQ